MEKMLIRIGVVSDVVCPWCYVGKRRLEKAMGLAADRFDFEVEYFPFELNPHMPEEGASYEEYMCEKFGSISRFNEHTEHLRQVAAQDGIEIDLTRQKTYPSTRNVHRIILMAREEDKQAEVAEAFFRAYFTDGVDLTKPENLISIGAGAGLDEHRISLLLQGSTGQSQIEMAEQELTALGITSVPLFIIENRVAITGAQSVEAFTQAFEEAAATMRQSELPSENLPLVSEEG